MVETRLVEQLREAGLKWTPQRELVCDVLDRAEDHPNAPEIHLMINERSEKSVALSTVYRILAEFEKKGLVQRREFGSQRARYEKCGGARHDHLIDTESGKVIGFENPAIEAQVKQIAEKAGFELVDYALNLFVVPRGTRSRKTGRPIRQRRSSTLR